MSDHEEEAQIGQFCALRAQPCNCPTNARYIDNARAKASGWASYSFQREVNKETGLIIIKKKPEAHHILCTSSVRKFLYADAKIQPILAGCTWCINESVNMMPLPLWGHTIKWYHSWKKAGKVVSRNQAPDEPKFSKNVQHDIDHNQKKGGYRSEIDTDIKKLKGQIKKALKAHKNDPEKIAGKLRSLSGKWDGELVTRGKRQGGTHEAWLRALQGNTTLWYEPFSMAATGLLTKRGFPKSFNDKTSATIDKIKKAMWG